MNRKSGAARSLSAQSFTEKQGQYLAFIYTYAHMFRRPPAETDMQRHFQESALGPSDGGDARTKWPDPASTRRTPKHRDPRCSTAHPHPGLAQNQPVIITVPRLSLIHISEPT